MIKTYAYSSDEKLSKNLRAREFRCKCGNAHIYCIDTDLIIKLQKLVDIFGADKIIITSGYRCPSHDRAVGGNGFGQHTKGTAADFKLYKNGRPINTKDIARKMQDLGFTGIGNIDKSYTAIHGDVRIGSKWFGDEAVPGGTSGSVTNDYYSYYGVSKNTSQIKELQKILNKLNGSSLKIDGIAGDKTLTEAKRHIIERNDSNELVKWVQNKLNSIGYECGKADGIAGDKTMKAIFSWQKNNNLGVGYLGGKDWNKLLI